MSKQYRFLVTGGAGFIGSHLVERLLKDGHFVRVLDNFSTGKEENLPAKMGTAKMGTGSFFAETNFAKKCACPHFSDFDLLRGDIRDYPTCLKACAGIDYVLHQAALRSVPKSMEIPHEYNAVNIDGTVNMLQAAREKGVRRFVFASSSSVYGDTDQFPESEDMLPQLISPYALTKLAGEYYCRIFSEHFNLETVCLRYFNVFGPRQALDDEYAVVIPKFITCMLNDEQPPIFGNGLQSRDFTYIDNVVEANLLAATNKWGLSPKGTVPIYSKEACAAKMGTVPEGSAAEKGTVPKGDCPLFSNSAVFNIAAGESQSVLELVKLLNQILGKTIEPQFLPPRAGDVFKTLADITKIKTTLGFTPKVNFEQGLKKTVEYFKSRNGTEPKNGDCPQRGLSPFLEECAGLKRPNRIQKEEPSFEDKYGHLFQ